MLGEPAQLLILLRGRTIRSCSVMHAPLSHRNFTSLSPLGAINVILSRCRCCCPTLVPLFTANPAYLPSLLALSSKLVLEPHNASIPFAMCTALPPIYWVCLHHAFMPIAYVTAARSYQAHAQREGNLRTKAAGLRLCALDRIRTLPATLTPPFRPLSGAAVLRLPPPLPCCSPRPPPHQPCSAPAAPSPASGWRLPAASRLLPPGWRSRLPQQLQCRCGRGHKQEGVQLEQQRQPPSNRPGRPGGHA